MYLSATVLTLDELKLERGQITMWGTFLWRLRSERGISSPTARNVTNKLEMLSYGENLWSLYLIWPLISLSVCDKQTDRITIALVRAKHYVTSRVKIMMTMMV